VYFELLLNPFKAWHATDFIFLMKNL